MDHHIVLSLFHIFMVGPLFLYVAFIRGQLMPWVFTILQILGLLVLVYHAYRILTRWRAHGLTVWINILHVFTVAPLLIYIGCMGYDTPRWAFEVMAMFGFAVIGYHIYSMVMQIQRIDDKKSLDAEKLTFKQ